MKKSCRKARIWQTGLIFCAVCAAIAGSAEAAQKLERRPSNKIEATATGRVSATIVAPVSAESANDLTFGMMVKNNQGKVTVDEDDNRPRTGNQFLFSRFCQTERPKSSGGYGGYSRCTHLQQ